MSAEGLQGSNPPGPLRSFVVANRRAFAVALPALLATAGAVTMVASAAAVSPDALKARYLAQAGRASRNSDAEAVRFCYERLVLLDPDQPDYRVSLAGALDYLGHARRAEALLGDLAPLDRAGYAPAQVWMARRRFRAGQGSPRALAVAELHLKRALQGQPDFYDANAMLGQIYADSGRPAEARPYLMKAARDRPEVLLTLARVARDLRDDRQARVHAGEALRIFRHRSESDPNDHQSRLLWAEAALSLGEYEKAEAILLQGLSVSPHLAYRLALGNVCLVRSDAVSRGPNADLGRRLALLEHGLRYCPMHRGLLDRVAEILKAGGPDADTMRATLKKMLAGGQATAVIHFVLGMDAWERGQAGQATVHLEEASRLAPEFDEATNNLAWVLLNATSPDLPRALKMIDLALERKSTDPELRHTRGLILWKMGRWKDALPDLEVALSAFPQRKDVHRALADVYEHLGEKDVAAEHRHLAGG